MIALLVAAHQSLMAAQGVQPPVRLAALITVVLLLLQPLQLLLAVLKGRQELVALLLMALQAVDPRVGPAAAVAAELLAGLAALMHHVRLHAVQDRRVAEQVVHRQLAVERHLANLRLLVVALLRAALSALVCKYTIAR